MGVTSVQEEADGVPINQKAYLGLQKPDGSCREGSPKAPSIISCQAYEVRTGARSHPSPPPGARAINRLMPRGIAFRTRSWWQRGTRAGPGPMSLLSTFKTGA
jgi:hypothetical protein